MKILQINAVYGYGSTGIIVRDINDLLQKCGYESYIACQKSSERAYNIYRMGNIFDWKLHALYTRISGMQAYASYLSTRSLFRYLDKIKPDIVHLHNLHGNYINLNMLLKYLAEKNIHTVITLHDCWFFTGKCTHYADTGCENWQFQCGLCPQNKKGIKSWLFDRSKKVFNDKKKLFSQIPNLTVVAASDWMLHQAQKSIFEDREIIRIYNGVDTQIFKPRESNFREKYSLKGRFIILGMANKWLLPENSQALKFICSREDINEKIVIVGCSAAQIKVLEGNYKVTALGYISKRDELAGIYSASDVFVNLTFADTLPTVNMESMCCGTPVITYDSCGSPELVVDSKTGYIVKQNDYKGLAEAIDKVKRKNIDRNECAKTGLRDFDNQKNYIKYLELYSNLIGTR